MPYWQLFYHVVWSTRDREPLLTPAVEAVVYDVIRAKVRGLGATLFALNGTEDHVHLVAAIPPALAVARFVGQVKGVAATRCNQASLPVSLHWQNEYGVFTLDGKRLPPVVAYVERQKAHHAQATVIPVLERTAEGGVRLGLLVREAAGAYAADGDGAWWEDGEGWQEV